MRRRRRGTLTSALASSLGLLAAVVVLVFALPRMLPGDPIARQLQQDGSTLSSAEDRAELLHHYGLDRSLPSQLRGFLGGLGHGDLGWSLSKHQRVTTLIAAALPWTLLVAGGAVLLAALAGFRGGLRAGWRSGKADRVLSIVAAIARSTPDYAVAAGLLIVFAVLLQWLPLTGARTPFSQGRSLLFQAGDIARHAALPMLSLTIALVGPKFLLARSATRGIAVDDFVLLARAKGLREPEVRDRHGAPNAMVPFMAQMSAQVGMAIGGSVFVERVFAYPGMGTLITEAVDARDYPLLDGCFLTLAVIVIVANVALDAWTRHHDPRMLAP